MAGRKRRSQEGDSKTGRGGGREVGSVGWGLDADPEEDIFLRRVIFSVLVAVVVCVCAWFLVTAVRSPEAAQPVLTVNNRSAPVREVWTVKLQDFPAAGRDAVVAVTSRPIMRQLAGGQEYRCLETGDGQMCLSVGRFDSPDAGELSELRDRFRNFTEDGDRPFAGACIYRYEE